MIHVIPIDFADTVFSQLIEGKDRNKNKVVSTSRINWFNDTSFKTQVYLPFGDRL